MQVQSPVDSSLRTIQDGISINEGFFLAFLEQKFYANSKEEQEYLEKLNIDLQELQTLKTKIENTKNKIGYSEKLEDLQKQYPEGSDDLRIAKSVLKKQLLDAAKISVKAILKYAPISMGASDKYFGANAR
jgi:hypothetical protein